MTFSPEYEALRDFLISRPITQDQLNSLICGFRSKINSNRRSSFIRSIEELIRVLEKRGYLEFNIQEFVRYYIGKVPEGERSVQEMMTRYQPRPTGIRPYVFENHYESSGLPAYSRQPSYGSRSSDTGTILEDVLPRNVKNLIIRDIGTNWKELARELCIREGDIDDIEYKHQRSLKEKARECLKLFEEEADPNRVHSKLLEALDKCGRRDLKESVQEILSRRH